MGICTGAVAAVLAAARFAAAAAVLRVLPEVRARAVAALYGRVRAAPGAASAAVRRILAEVYAVVSTLRIPGVALPSAGAASTGGGGISRSCWANMPTRAAVRRVSI